MQNELILYHCSYCKVETPDLKKCSAYKDFGQGFYLTSSKEQAINFAKLTTKKAVQNKIIEQAPDFKGIVSAFKIKNLQNLKIKEFTTADKEWLHCIVAHRKNELFTKLLEQYKNFDIIVGKIANDSTNATIVAYMSQTFGQVGTDQADNICISLLLPERLKDQYCFRTKKAISNLQFEESFTV